MATTKYGIVKRIEQVHRDVRLITVGMVEPEELGFVGGQYIIITSEVQNAEGKEAKGTFTIASKESVQNEFQLAIKQLVDGPCTTWLCHTLKVGDKLPFSGPWGAKNFETEIGAVNALYMATDTGITSLISFLNGKNAQQTLKRCRVLWFLSSKDYFLDPEFVKQALPETVHENFHIEYIAEPKFSLRIGQACDFIESLLDKFKPQYSLLAGDGDIVVPVKEILYKRGLGANVVTEIYFHKPLESEKGSGTLGKNLRKGFTTGANAAAAAKAAARVLVGGKLIQKIDSVLPNGQKVTFNLHRCEINNDGSATCSVIKDGGDDPDCTHGAEIVATVSLDRDNAGIKIDGGEGVAKVTQPGLGLEVGTAAINPVPRRNIAEMVSSEIEESGFAGASVIISVPGGKEISKKTINERLGLIGGISILGTTGIVVPYSTASYKASIIQQIALAKHQGCEHVIFTTGGRSEQYAMAMYPDSPSAAFVQAGDFIGAALKTAVSNEFESAIVVSMIGKMSKMADGKTQTHTSGSKVNMELLAKFADELGAEDAIIQQIGAANTARHALEIARENGVESICTLISQKASEKLTEHVKQKLKIKCHLVDFEGCEIGCYPRQKND